MKLSKPMLDFVRHWGEMGARWGVNRSVAQIHAVLYLADKPLTADEIVEMLGIARSNVSNSLKELQSFSLVELTHVMGERRDHFRAIQDPWDMVLAIIEERKRREIDPTFAMLRGCVDEAERDSATPAAARARLKAMLDVLKQVDEFYARIRRVPRPMLKRVVKFGDRIANLIGG
jgi:DNA-binding transcriptional regulator GbsR (MarR family)